MPHVPPAPCSTPGCPELKPCPTHQTTPWGESPARRRAHGATLTSRPAARRRRRILNRHHGICHICGEPFADEIDHVISLAEGGPDTDDNLRPIHSKPCHIRKTRAEAARGRARARGQTPPPPPPLG